MTDSHRVTPGLPIRELMAIKAFFRYLSCVDLASKLDECIGLFAAVNIQRKSAEEVGPNPSKA